MGKKTDEADRSVHRYMNGLVGELCELVAKALKRADTNAIHHARVTTRRLTAAVRLLEPILSRDYEKPFSKSLKSLRKRLGPLRDLDVMIEHLKQYESAGRQSSAAQWLSDQLHKERAACREEAAAESPGKALSKLGAWLAMGEEVRAAEPTLPAMLAGAIHAQLAAFADESTRLASPVAQTSGTPQDPHELRITGKVLRYSLELSIIAGVAVPQRCLKQFKQLQEFLGLWHDYVVLSEKAMRVALDCGLGTHQPQVYEQVMELARLLWRRAQRYLAGFCALWLKQGDRLVTMIRQALPPIKSDAVVSTATDANDPASPDAAAFT